jgi:hypothetical protein
LYPDEAVSHGLGSSPYRYFVCTGRDTLKPNPSGSVYGPWCDGLE